jgi:basic membrane protein A
MKLETAKCTTCGASLKLSQDKAISECSYCKSQIIVSNALDFAKVKLDRSEDIKKYRENLAKFVKNNSLDEILRVTGLIKDIIPDDNLASYYFAYAKQLIGSPKFIYQFYESKQLLTKDENEEIVNHIIEHSDLRDKTRVTSFLKQHASNKLSDYLETYDKRVIEEDNYSDIPRDIFICFSSENKAIAKKVYETLEADGYSTWISLKNLRPNNKENYWDDIKKAINSSSIVLVISSGQAMVSKDVIKEIEIAKKENKKLIEYKIDEVKHTSFFKYIFDGSKWIEGYTNKGLDNLKKRILEEKYVFKDKPEESNYQEVEPKPIKVKPIKQNSNKPKSSRLLVGGIIGGLALVVGLLVSMTNQLTNSALNNVTNNEFFEIAMITDIGSIDDKSWNQAAWEGVDKYASDNNKSAEWYQPRDATTAAYVEAINLAVNRGAKIVVTPGFLFEEAIFIVQDRYPDVRFVLIDGVPRNVDYSVFKTSDNTLSILFAEHESGFLAGYSVVRDGYEKLGFMGGLPFPAVKKFGFGFVAGVYYAAKEMNKLDTVSIPNSRFEYLGTFGPSDTVKSTAYGWYNAGTQVIFHAAGGAGNSIMSAASEATNKWVVGVDVNQMPQSQRVLTSAIKGIDVAAYDSIESHFNNSWRGGYTKIYTAANNGVGIPDDDFSRFIKYDQAAYNTILYKVANGTIVVPETYSALRTFVTNLGVNTNDPNKFPTAANADAKLG